MLTSAASVIACTKQSPLELMSSSTMSDVISYIVLLKTVPVCSVVRPLGYTGVLRNGLIFNGHLNDSVITAQGLIQHLPVDYSGEIWSSHSDVETTQLNSPLCLMYVPAPVLRGTRLYVSKSSSENVPLSFIKTDLRALKSPSMMALR